MNHRHGHSGALGIFAIVAAIAFAFGERTARVIVGSALLIAAAFFGYIILRVAMGTI